MARKQTAPKGSDRLQKLREWKEKRNCLKEQEKKKQLKPFYAGSAKVVNVTKPVNTVTSKPLTRLQMKNATKAFSTAPSQQPSKQTKTTGARDNLGKKLWYT